MTNAQASVNDDLSRQLARRPWRAATVLLPHQLDAVAKLLPTRVAALFMEMGTGKTRTVIELARLRQTKIDRVVWFCPVAVKPTIFREILKHTDCSEDDIDVFGDKTDEQTVPEDRFWHIVGIESMSSSARIIGAAASLITERTMVVVDESTYIKGHFSKRTKRITLISAKSRYRLILTGTPITQGVVDLYAQMKFLSPKILGYNSFFTFAKNHLVYSDKYRGLIKRTLHTDWIAERIKPYVYQVTKAECLNLPDKLYADRYCDLTAEQQAAYQRAKEDFVDDLMKYDDGRELQNGIAIFRLFSRLQGIACGFFTDTIEVEGRDTFGRTVRKKETVTTPLPHKRLDALTRILDTVTDSHIVVWTKYRQSVDEILDFLKKSDRPGYGFDGRVAESGRQEVVDRWVSTGGVLVATQSLGSHGLNDLVAAATVIFYSNGFKYSERAQTEDRHHRLGQDSPVTYIDIWADCKIEDRIASALASKGNALTQLRREIEAIKHTDKKKIKELIMRL